MNIFRQSRFRVGRASLPAKCGGDNALSADWGGQTFPPTDWGGQTFLSVKSITLNALTPIFSLISLVFIFLCTSIITGCDKVEELVVATEAPLEIIPLAIGNSWTYEYEGYLADTLTYSGNSTISIDSVFTIGDHEWYRESFRPDIVYTRFYRNSELGYEYYEMPNYEHEYPQTALYHKYPVNKGENWSDWRFNVTTVISIDEEVEVKAGLFSGCIQYRSSSYFEEWQSTYYYTRDVWIKPGIGRVKSESESVSIFYDFDGESRYSYSVYKSQLTEYEIK